MSTRTQMVTEHDAAVDHDLLAFTRRNPYLHRSPYVVKWSGR